MIEWIHDTSPYVELRISGKLNADDYETFTPKLESLITKHGKISLLVEMVDFEGWTGKALWEDLKFDARHFKDFERIAMVGEEKWEKAMAVFCKPFTSAKVAYFKRGDRTAARQWLREESPVEAIS